MNSLNQLDDITCSGTYTVAGLTSGDATSVTVNSQSATRYTDRSFAKDGFSHSDGDNTFTAVATDTLGRQDTHTVTAYLPATASYVYDDNGNLLNDGRRYFHYDDENQLSVVVVSNAWLSAFSYDGKLRRRIRKEYTWQSSAWVLTNEVRYVYDGNLVIQERDGNNLPAVTYTRGKDLSGGMEGAGGIAGLLARTDHSTLNSQQSTFAHVCYHSDGNGNITALASTNGLLLGAYYYDPYGNLLGLAGHAAEANLYRFSSKEYHPNSGLVYYLYRYYEPNLQRWVNKDPVNEEGFEVIDYPRAARQSYMGLDYAFLHNKPVENVDVFGLLLFDPKTCRGKDTKGMRKAFKERCAAAKANGCFAECGIDPKKAKAMQDACDAGASGPEVVCESSGSGDCVTRPGASGANRCGYTDPATGTIHLCMDNMGGGTGCSPGCALIHELAHSVGGVGPDDGGFGKDPDKRAYDVQKCAGCP